jgi:hypothetical protein
LQIINKLTDPSEYVKLAAIYNGRVRATIESSPIPRFATFQAQALAFALLSTNAVVDATIDKNKLLLYGDTPIPERFSHITIVCNHDSGQIQSVSAQSPSFLWNVQNKEQKEKFQMPLNFNNGWLNWALTLSNYDPDCQYARHFEFTHYFPQGVDIPMGETNVIILRVITGDLDYKPHQGSLVSYLPESSVLQFPLFVNDFRNTFEIDDQSNVIHPTAIGVSIRSAQWSLKTDDPSYTIKRLDNLKTNYANGAYRDHIIRSRKFFLFGIIFVFFAPLIVFFIYSRSARKKQTK